MRVGYPRVPLLRPLSQNDLNSEIVEFARNLRWRSPVGNNPINSRMGSQDCSSDLIELAVVNYQNDLICDPHARTEGLDLSYLVKHQALLEVDGPSPHDDLVGVEFLKTKLGEVSTQSQF